MDKMAIAIQQTAVQEAAAQQSLNGIVDNSGDKQNFDKVLKSMLHEASKSKGQKALEQLLKKSGEENAQELAAQLMAQNPLILAILTANTETSAENLQSVLSQLTQTPQQIEGVAGEKMPQTMPITAQAEAATMQPVAQDTFSTATLQALQPQQAAQNQTAPAQQAAAYGQIAVQGEGEKQAAQQPLNGLVLNESQLNQAKGAEVQIVAAAPSEQKQPQQLAEKADFEAIAQKIKFETAKAQQGETGQQSTEGGSEKNSAAKEQKLTDSGVKQTDEQAVQVNFEKQITSAPTTENKITVKNQGSQEIIRQTVEGIKQNAAKGKEEFVMKLSPQGLGEITVKLVSENGRTTMQITAQNQNIQRILGAELEALKQAVRPYNVEVKEVNTANQSQLDMNMSNQNSSQQQYQSSAASFFYNQQQSKSQYTYQSYLTGAQIQEIAEDDNSVIAQAIIQGTAINLHI